mgnify:CR=1 FL=1
MTDKNIKHGKRNSDYWDRLIERYYSGNTTIDEEKINVTTKYEPYFHTR